MASLLNTTLSQNTTDYRNSSQSVTFLTRNLLFSSPRLRVWQVFVWRLQVQLDLLHPAPLQMRQDFRLPRPERREQLSLQTEARGRPRVQPDRGRHGQPVDTQGQGLRRILRLQGPQRRGGLQLRQEQGVLWGESWPLFEAFWSWEFLWIWQNHDSNIIFFSKQNMSSANSWRQDNGTDWVHFHLRLQLQRLIFFFLRTRTMCHVFCYEELQNGDLNDWFSNTCPLPA